MTKAYFNFYNIAGAPNSHDAICGGVFLCVSYWKAFLNREKVMGVLPREDEDDDKRVGDNDTEPMTGVTDLGRTCMTLVVCQQFFSVQSPSDACSTNATSEKMLSSTLMILTYSSRTNLLKEIDFQPVTCHYTIIRRKSELTNPDQHLRL